MSTHACTEACELLDGWDVINNIWGPSKAQKFSLVKHMRVICLLPDPCKISWYRSTPGCIQFFFQVDAVVSGLCCSQDPPRRHLKLAFSPGRGGRLPRQLRFHMDPSGDWEISCVSRSARARAASTAHWTLRRCLCFAQAALKKWFIGWFLVSRVYIVNIWC